MHAREVAGPHRRLEFALQTNGTLLDDKWAALLHDEGFLVGLSMDGPAEMHDAYRVDKRGGPTYSRVRAAWDLLAAHEVDTNIMCTVHAANAEHPLAVYRHFRDDLGVRDFQFIPIVERATPETLGEANLGWRIGVGRPLYTQNSGDLVTERTVQPEQWGRFLVEIFDEWVQRDVGTVFVQTFRRPRSARGSAWGRACASSGRRAATRRAGAQRRPLRCDHFVEPEYLLGNILETHVVDLVASSQQRAFGQAKADTLPAYCRSCDARFACNGKCPRTASRVDARRRGRAQLPLRGLQGILPPHRRPDAHDGRPVARWTLRRRDHERRATRLIVSGREGAPGRPPLRRAWRSRTR